MSVLQGFVYSGWELILISYIAPGLPEDSEIVKQLFAITEHICDAAKKKTFDSKLRKLTSKMVRLLITLVNEVKTLRDTEYVL